MQIYYGTESTKKDVTDICLTKLTKDNIVRIPSGDNNRAKHFGDPVYGTVKKIFIVLTDQETVYEHYYYIKINTLDNNIEVVNDQEIDKKLAGIQSRLKLKYGSFHDELPEQKMVTRYLTGKEKILEIGGNIGRNTLVIASILEKNTPNNNFVTLECDPISAYQLRENRDRNGFNYHVECSALSKRNLIQQGWNTIVSDEVLPGYKKVNTINWTDLVAKYNISFDTLVLDCEGAFYYILMDMPEILDNINLIIMENDYTDPLCKAYVDDVMQKAGFYVDYVEAGGWGCCYNNFFEVWKKST